MKIDKATKLRKMFNKKNKIIRIVGAHDGLSAKLVEKNGFDGVWASGLEISTSFAVPDASILTMSQYLEAAKVMNDAVSIPVVTDCDTGYGNSNNVMYMVKKYEAAGIAAVVIEDKLFPKVNSFIPGRQELAPISEFVGKIMAAKSVQSNPDFMVIARIEALIAGWGMEEALRRANAYMDAGADAILIHSKSKTPDEISSFINLWNNKLPVVVIPTTYSGVTAKELQNIGAKMVIYANQGIRASIKAMDETFRAISKHDSTKLIEEQIASMDEVFELQGMPVMKIMEKKYHRTKEIIKGIVLAAGTHADEESLKDILVDIPLTMIDVNGKPLLQRQQEVLNRAFIQDITAVGGYLCEKIVVDGVNVVQNENYATTGNLETLMCAKNKLNGKMFICYSDILFDVDVVEKALKSSEDILLLVDRGYSIRSLKKLDMELIAAERAPLIGRRILESQIPNHAVKIGSCVPENEAHYEFAGMILLSEKGTERIKYYYEKSKEKYGNQQPFHEAPDFNRASITDLIQEMIDCGEKVTLVEVDSGWLEVHNMGNYRIACEYVASR